MSITCNECNETFRKECLLTHITKEHPTYFLNEIFCFNPLSEHGEYTGLRQKLALQDVIYILDGSNKAYFIGSENDEKGAELFLDFGNKTVYNKEHTAIKHILEHPEKHINNLFSTLKDNMTKEIFLTICKALVAKPQGNHDAQQARKISKELEEYKNNTVNKIDKLEKLAQEYEHVKSEGGFENMYKKINQHVVNITASNLDLKSKLSSMMTELEDYRAEAQLRHEQNKKDGELMDEELKYCDRIRKECDIKIKKEQNALDVKLKKAKEDFEKDIKNEHEKFEKEQEKFDKKERKFKKEIKAYKHQLEMKKLQSDSDSDSD